MIIKALKRQPRTRLKTEQSQIADLYFIPALGRHRQNNDTLSVRQASSTNFQGIWATEDAVSEKTEWTSSRDESRSAGGEEITQQAKCLPCKPEALSSIPRPHEKSQV